MGGGLGEGRREDEEEAGEEQCADGQGQGAAVEGRGGVTTESNQAESEQLADDIGGTELVGAAEQGVSGRGIANHISQNEVVQKR